MDQVYEMLRSAGVGAAAVGLVCVIVSLVLPEKVIEAIPSNRAMLLVVGMITSIIAFSVAAFGMGMGG